MQQEVQHKAVLFDFDGTLGRSLASWTDAYHEALLSVGVECDIDEVKAACFMKGGSAIQREFSIRNINAFSEDVWQRVHGKMESVEMYPQLEQTLFDLLISSFRLAVVTNSRRSLVQPVLERWDVDGLFGTLVSIEDVSKGKPSPEPIQLALKELKVPPAEAWMVGDSPADIEAGKAAGVKTIAFSPEENCEYFDREMLRELRPTHVAHSLAEVRRLIVPGMR